MTTLIDRLLSDKTSPLHSEAADEIIRLQNEMRGMVTVDSYAAVRDYYQGEIKRLREELRKKDLVQRTSEQASTTVRSS